MDRHLVAYPAGALDGGEEHQELALGGGDLDGGHPGGGRRLDRCGQRLIRVDDCVHQVALDGGPLGHE
ncbi:hypothetical protein IWX62_000196 [Arthrobacter sp. CAN_A1]